MKTTKKDPAELIRALPNPAVADLATHGEAVSFRKNAVILNEEEHADYIYILLSGRAKVYVSDLDGHSMVIGTCEPGDLLGEMSLDGGPRSASAMTLEPTVCAVVTRAQLHGAIAANPEIAFHLLGCLIKRARMAIGNVRSLALLDGYGRIARLLLTLARPVNGALRITEAMTQREFGDRAGVSRDMVNRVFRDLAAGGYIALNDDRSIDILRTLPKRW
jgi:CRP/FNR family cyclic AMP-dependent transcriptional regulator